MITERELEQRLKENQELQTIIDAQEITPADVERMMSAKNSLEQSLQLLCEQRDNVQKDVWTRYAAPTPMLLISATLG